MKHSQTEHFSDLDVRHFIYATFAQTSRPPTTREAADYFKTSISTIEDAFVSLANAHHIALAPGSYSIWMAHPFSGIATNFVAEVAGKKHWGN